jgi:hypothetical protein
VTPRVIAILPTHKSINDRIFRIVLSIVSPGSITYIRIRITEIEINDPLMKGILT